MAQAKDTKGKNLMQGDHFFVTNLKDPGVPENYVPDLGGFVWKVPKRGILYVGIQTSLGLRYTTLKSRSVKKSGKAYAIDNAF